MQTSLTLSTFKNHAALLSIMFIIPLAYAQSTTGDGPSPSLVSSILSANQVNASSTDVAVAMEFNDTEQAKKGVVGDIDPVANAFVFYTRDRALVVQNNASTTAYLGTGTEISLADIHENMSVYVFGYLRKDDLVIHATKIVVTNKSKLERQR